jgi:ubiquinone/menaquinone biosynthesis C-methylase UbiE
MTITQEVRAYWNRQSCGTDQTRTTKHTKRYFDEIEEFRYGHDAGTDFLQFAKAGANLHGIDITQEAAENVAKRLAVYGCFAEDVLVGNAEHLPFDANRFDLVYSWGVIHHADDTEQCLREISRVTKLDGAVKVMIYNYNSLDAWVCALRYGGLSRHKAIWNHMESIGTKAFTKAETLAMFNRCGLRITSVTFGQQLVRKGARFERIRRAIRVLLPKRWDWYMMIDARKCP